MKSNHDKPEIEEIQELVLKAKNHHKNMSFIALANSIIGVSILSIPFCFQKCGIVLSILLILISNYITRKCCYFLLKCSIITRRKNFEGLGFFAFGKNGKTLVELCVIGYLMGTCVAFFVVIGDLSPEILGKFVDINGKYVASLRVWLIIIITLVLVLPLSFQRNVDSLSFVCSASIGFYVCLVLKTISESTITLKLDDKWTSNVEIWRFSGLLQCLPIFSMSLSCQLQLFEVYENQPFGSIEKMYSNVKTATSICTVVYIFIGFFGYIAFYSKELSGNILVNFTQSLASDAIKIGFVLSVACSIPLIILPCRNSLISFLQRRTHSSDNSSHKPVTIFIVLTTMIIGILLPSIEVVIGLIGSTIGVLICIIFPAATFLKINQKNSKEKLISQVFVIAGFVIMVLGTYANLNAIDASKSGSHLDEKNELLKLAVNQQKLHNLAIEKNYEKFMNEQPKIEKPPPPIPPTKNHTTNKELLKSKIKEAEANKLKIEQTVVTEKPEIINKDAIEKEEQEIAINKQEIQDTNAQIKELKETKSSIEKDLKEIKNELKKQNEETQKLVMKKFEEIAEKVDRIEKANEENIADKSHLEEHLKEPEKPEEKPKENEILEEKKDSNDKPIDTAKVEPDKNQGQDPRNDPIVVMLKNNLSNINKSEALSYQVGEEVAQKKINLSDIIKPKDVISEASLPKVDEVEKPQPKEEIEEKNQDVLEEIKQEILERKKEEKLEEEKKEKLEEEKKAKLEEIKQEILERKKEEKLEEEKKEKLEEEKKAKLEETKKVKLEENVKEKLEEKKEEAKEEEKKEEKLEDKSSREIRNEIRKKRNVEENVKEKLEEKKEEAKKEEKKKEKLEDKSSRKIRNEIRKKRSVSNEYCELPKPGNSKPVTANL